MRAARATPTILLMLVATWIAAAEIARLIAETLSGGGLSYSIDETIGPLALAHTDAWGGWTSATTSPVVFLTAHTIVMLVFYGLTAVLARRLAAGSTTALTTILALVIAEGVEVLATTAASTMAGLRIDPGPVGWIVAIAATAKWVLVVAVIVVGLRAPVVRLRLGSGIRRLAVAVYAQRLSLVVVLFLGAIALIPRSGILEQLPDAQRAWLDPGGNGAAEALIAIGALLIAALALFVLGRQRSRRYWLTAVRLQVPTRSSSYLWWLSAPIVTVATWLLLLALGRGDLVDVPEFPLFVAVVSAFPVVSVGIRLVQAKRGRAIWAPAPPAGPDYRSGHDVWVAGDVIAGLVAAIAGLSLVRSFIAPALLSLVPGSGVSGGEGAIAWIAAIGGTLFGSFILTLSGRVAARFDRELTKPDAAGRLHRLWPILDPSTPTTPLTFGSTALLVVAFLLAVCTIAAMMIFPRPVSSALGIVGSTTIILAAWSVVIGTVTLRLQYRRPLELFRVLHLRADPVLIMLILIPALLSQVGGAPNLHAIERDPAAIPLTARPTLSQAFDSWLTRTSACDLTAQVGDGGATTTVRPLIIAASEGGGIRAATWTVDVFDTLKASGACGASDVLLSSGVSGGSVGLALFHGSGKSRSPAKAVASISNPDALGVGLTGALVGDTLASTTGLRIPSLDERNGVTSWTWQDRAGLMQSVWRAPAAAPQLASPWDDQTASPTGLLVLNSTAAGYGCRVLISQLDLRSGDHSLTGVGSDGTAVAPNCQGSTVELPDSLDLQDVYGDCPLKLDWATAAMLSARFPLISPAGRTSARAEGTSSSACTSLPDLQLIDGGYSEPTGLGTLSDLSPALAGLVRNHNANVGTAGPYVVPVVLYLQNSSGADVTARPQKVNAELEVPIVGIHAAGQQTSASTWLQRMSATFSQICPAGDTACAAALARVRATTPGGVVVVAPTTRASIAAPLGWALSDFSRNNLAAQVAAQRCSAAGPRRYGGLAELLSLLGASPDCETGATR